MRRVLQILDRWLADRRERRRVSRFLASLDAAKRDKPRFNAAQRLIQSYYGPRRTFEPKRPHLVRIVRRAAVQEHRRPRDKRGPCDLRRVVWLDRSKYPPAKLREIRADGVHR